MSPAELADLGSGLAPVSEGWFVVNVRDADGRRALGPGVRYPVSEPAARYGASVAAETSDWRQAYATVEPFRRERPPSRPRLPWA